MEIRINNDQDCNQYEGEYENDLKDGFGVYKWKSGNIYRGRYKEDLRHGYGEMYWTDGSTYKGMWHKGIQHGKGLMEFPDGKVKEGLFENNIFTGPVFNRLNLFHNKPLKNSNQSSLDKLTNSMINATTTTTFESDYMQIKTSSNMESVKKYSNGSIFGQNSKTMSHQNRFVLNKKRLKINEETKNKPRIDKVYRNNARISANRNFTCSSMSQEGISREEIGFDTYGNKIKSTVPKKRISTSNSVKRNIDQEKSNFYEAVKSKNTTGFNFRLNSKSNRRPVKPKLDKIQLKRSEYSYSTNKSSMIKKKSKMKTREMDEKNYTLSDFKNTNTIQLVQNDETRIISNLSRVLKASKLRMKGNMNSTK